MLNKIGTTFLKNEKKCQNQKTTAAHFHMCFCRWNFTTTLLSSLWAWGCCFNCSCLILPKCCWIMVSAQDTLCPCSTQLQSPLSLAVQTTLDWPCVSLCLMAFTFSPCGRVLFVNHWIGQKIIKCWMFAFHFSLHNKWNGYCPFSHSTHTSLPVCGLCGTNYFTGSPEFWMNTLLNNTKPWDSFPAQPQTNIISVTSHWCNTQNMVC